MPDQLNDYNPVTETVEGLEARIQRIQKRMETVTSPRVLADQRRAIERLERQILSLKRGAQQ